MRSHDSQLDSGKECLQLMVAVQQSQQYNDYLENP
jgi:hypothetical protein